MSLEDYEPVAVRLSRLLETLRAQDLAPRVVTVMLSEPGSDVCVFRAELWIGSALMATGHAEEVRDTSGKRTVNASSHVENCETSSLGRMCESYAPTSDHTKRPSREEMQKVQRVSGATTITESGDLASDKQRNLIRAVSKSLGKLPPPNLDGLTKRQASQIIDELRRAENGLPSNPHAPEEPF